MGKKRDKKRDADTNSVEAYRMISLISTSPDTKVFLAQCVPLNSKLVAIKSIKVDGDVMLPDLDPFLYHPNLLTPLRLFLTEDHRVWAVTPFFSGGSLRSILHFLSPQVLSEQCIAAVLKPVLSAVAYLHRRRTFHGNIKLGNIILGSEKPGNIIVRPESPVIKLADFGVSESFYSDENHDRPYWKSPESSAASDVWTFGVTAMELVHGGPPLSPASLAGISESLRFRIRKRFGWSLECKQSYKNKAVELENNFSEDFKDMVASCLDRDLSKRPTAEGLLGHWFFSESQDSDSLIRRTLMDGIPSVEKRLNEFNIGPGEKAKASVGNTRRVVSWEFDKERFKLEPVYEIGAEPERKKGFDEILRTAHEAMKSVYKRCKIW